MIFKNAYFGFKLDITWGRDKRNCIMDYHVLYGLVLLIQNYYVDLLPADLQQMMEI